MNDKRYPGYCPECGSDCVEFLSRDFQTNSETLRYCLDCGWRQERIRGDSTEIESEQVDVQ